MTIARRVLTTIVRPAGNATTLTPSSRTHELVPQREEVFTTEQMQSPALLRDALHRVQRHVAEATQAARSLPVLGGTYWPDVSFVANTAHTFVHGIVGGNLVSWLVGSVRPASPNALAVSPLSIVEISQDAPHGRIVMSASANCIADVWLFPKPSPLP